MNLVIVVESNNKQHIEKTCLKPGEPITIGRAFQNDVIVDDEYLDANHLEISCDNNEQIIINDMGTRNGTRVRKEKILEPSRYDLGSKITFGESTIVIHDMEELVAPALKHETVHTVARVYSSFGWVLLAAIFAVVGILAESYFVESEQTKSEKLVERLIGNGIVVVGWSLTAGLVGHILRQQAYLKLHFILLCFFIAISPVLIALANIVSFNLDTNLSSAILTDIPMSAGIILLIYGTLSLSTRLNIHKKCGLTGLLAISPIVFSLVTPMLAEDHEKWYNYASVDRVDQVPSLLFREPVTLNGHLTKTERLFAKLDAQIDDKNALDTPTDEISKDGYGAILVSEIE